MTDGKPARLEDMLSYKPESYLSDDELSLIQSTFSGTNGAKLIKILRKILMPTISDPSLPIEEFGKDMFMGQFDFKQTATEEVKPIVLGIQLATKAIMGGLIMLKSMGNVKEESDQEKKARLAKDSTK